VVLGARHPGAASLVLALIGLASSACDNDFARGGVTRGDVTDGGGADGTTTRQDPLPGVPELPTADDGGTVSDPRCAPATTAACLTNELGAKIPGLTDPARGSCAVGAKTCSPAGVWGPCKGAVGPRPRDCESSVDDDCDGAPDDTIDGVCECNVSHPLRRISGGPNNCACSEACGTDHQWVECTPPSACECTPLETRACTGASGCGGGAQSCTPGGSWGACSGAPDAATYCLDRDDDTYCAASTACRTVCPGALGPEWKTSCPTTDCDDDDATVNPNAKPSCIPARDCHRGMLSCSAIGSTCADTGTVAADRTPCPGGVCNAGACVACVAGDVRCADNSPQTCSGGGQWVSGTTCAPVASCSSTGTAATCACPAGYTGDGTTCVAVPVLVCTARANINSRLTLVGDRVGFVTDAYPVDGGTERDLDSCASTAIGTAATPVSATVEAKPGFSYGDIAGGGITNKLYASTSRYVDSADQTARTFAQYTLPANTFATVPLSIIGDLPRGNSSFLGPFVIDPVSGYVFLEARAGLVVATIPEPLPGQAIAPSSCYGTTDTLGALAAGGSRAVVFDSTESRIYGVTAPGCSATVIVVWTIAEVDALATDGIRVIFNDGTNVYGCPFTGCGAGALDHVIIGANQGVVTSIALDDTKAYWVGPSGLMSCAKAGCPNGPEVVTALATPPASVAVDATSVYFSKGNAVYRIAKQ
jgi:hypothetical protein